VRARDPCERLDLAITSKNIESTRHSSSAWSASASELEAGLFTAPPEQLRITCPLAQADV
jgi:hypothetical protein